MINKYIFNTLLLGILFIATACQNQIQVAELEIGDSFSKDVFFISGRKFIKKEISLGRVTKSQKLFISEESLNNFWEVMHNEQVDKWSTIYLPQVKSERTAFTHWVLKLHLNHSTLVTSGGGAFPGDKNLLSPVGPDPSNRFYNVLAAFQNLSRNTPHP